MPLGNLSEVNFADSFKAETIRIVEPIAKVLKGKKKQAKMLEEQIRDTYPCDVEPKEEKDEEI
jgi:predicted transcriptional regulator